MRNIIILILVLESYFNRSKLKGGEQNDAYRFQNSRGSEEEYDMKMERHREKVEKVPFDTA